jgi:hypothetical protein
MAEVSAVSEGEGVSSLPQNQSRRLAGPRSYLTVLLLITVLLSIWFELI